MKRLLSHRWFLISAGLVLVLHVSLTAGAWHFRVWSWHDAFVYYAMSRECHPVWKDLHYGRIAAGQHVEDVIAATKPVRVDRFDEFVRLSYQEGLSFTGVGIVAKDGRVMHAAAGSCTWDRIFFDRMSPQEWKAYSDATNAYLQRKKELRDGVESADHGKGHENHSAIVP